MVNVGKYSSPVEHMGIFAGATVLIFQRIMSYTLECLHPDGPLQQYLTNALRCWMSPSKKHKKCLEQT